MRTLTSGHFIELWKEFWTGNREDKVGGGDENLAEASQEEVIEGLRKSKRRFKLYPVLTEKGTMTILDGKTRKKADPTWPEQEIEIKDPKDRVLIPLHANYRRQVSKKETQTYLLTLADMLEKEGVQPQEMVSKITELTPFTERYVRKLLPKKYKMAQMARLPRKKLRN